MIKFELEGKFKLGGKSFVKKLTVEDGEIIDACEYFGCQLLDASMREAIRSGKEKLFMNLLEINHGKPKN